MRTDDLLRALAADVAPERPVAAGLAGALLLGGAASLAAVIVVLGLRPDIPAALASPAVALKQLWPIWLAIASGGAVLRLATPGGRTGHWLAALAALPVLLAAAAGLTLVALPAAAWRPAFLGGSAASCLGLVAALSLPILAPVLWALRRGASLHPGLSGALAGLLSGGTAAGLYALHCTEDSPLFYVAWYSLAILAVTALGALLGRRFLRW